MFLKKLKLKNNLRFYRRINELSYAELGDLVGRSDRSMSFIEKGETMPSLELAIRLSKLFRVSLDELFFEEGNEPEKRVVLINEEYL